MRITLCSLFCFVIIFKNVYSANNEDTLSTAKTYIQAGKYKKAENLLQKLHQSHPDDLNILWLYAQSAYWAKHYTTFNDSYSKAILKFPNNYYLKLDYALKLVENGDIKKALPLLEIYKSYDPSSSDLKVALSKIQYWQGNYSDALQTLNSKKFEKEKIISVNQLKQDIYSAKSSWIKINCNYLSDDQPLKTIAPTIEAGTFFHPLLSPFISVTTPVFLQSTDSKSAQEISVGDKLIFFKAGVTANISAGYMQLPDKTNSLIGNFEITKTSFKYFQLSAQATHQPYLITISSIANSVVPYHYSFSAGWNNLNSWNGKITSSMDQFTSDNNSIYNVNGWLFAPPLKISVWQLRIGYAYSYSSSQENRFISKTSLAEIISNYTTGNTGITGIYNPYFTPDNQNVHSALLNISFNPRKRFSMGINANIGFLGSTKNPYLYLDKNNAGATFINKNYSTVNFYPDEISAFILFNLTNKFSVKTNYSFLKNNFYTSNLIGVTFKASFWNEEKK